MIRLCSVEKNIVTIELSIELAGSMTEAEACIRSAVNEVGVTLSRESLKRFDADGSPIMTGPVKWTSKGQVDKVYQTPHWSSVDYAPRECDGKNMVPIISINHRTDPRTACFWRHSR